MFPNVESLRNVNGSDEKLTVGTHGTHYSLYMFDTSLYNGSPPASRGTPLLIKGLNEWWVTDTSVSVTTFPSPFGGNSIFPSTSVIFLTNSLGRGGYPKGVIVGDLL